MQNHPDRPGLCQELLKKIPDLRTLNTLHSEKLLAFKMTEQQNQLDQQQQQNQLENQFQNGAAGMWSIMMNGCTDDFNRKSPEEAGSSSWSDETTSMEDIKSLAMLDEVKSPLGSVSSTESVCSDEYHHHGPSKHAASAPLLAATLAGTVCPIRRQAAPPMDDHQLHHQVIVRPVSCRYQRKQDSPTDSGIESGTEKLERPTAHSAPTSVCSSPRSTVDDHTHMHHMAVDSHQPTAASCIEDMPVLKRVLQAPPLYDTNSLMDEAYKPHKKFRALRGAKDSAEAEAVRPAAVTTITTTAVGAATAASVPAAAALLQHSPHLRHHLTSSSLSSTHSTLAKSLRESPKMTPEQIKRTEVIHNFIMREDTVYQTQQQQPPPPPPPTRWHTPVITSASAQNCNRLSSPTPPPPAAATTTAAARYAGVLARVLSPSSSVSPPPATAHRRTPSPNVVNLQVGITNAAAAHQQPLNLSKKLQSPSPTPASSGASAASPPPSAPAQVAMEA